MTRIAGLIIVFSVITAGQAIAQTNAADTAKNERGRAVYQYWCGPCHSEGRGNPGTGALAFKYKNQPGVPAVLADRTNLTPESVKFFVRRGVSVMPPFRKTEITDSELDALASFLTRNRPR